MLKDSVSTVDHQGTLAWVDDGLEWACSRSQTKPMELLKLVRDEILLDLELSEGPWPTPTRANGTFSGADRNV